MGDDQQRYRDQRDAGDSNDDNPFDDYDQYNDQYSVRADDAAIASNVNADEEYGYASATKGNSARERIEEQRRLTRGQPISGGGRDRSQQRFFYTAATILALLVIFGTLAFLILSGNNKSSNIAAQPTATRVAVGGNAARTPLPPAVNTPVIITDTAAPTPSNVNVGAVPTADNRVNVDATAKPVEPTQAAAVDTPVGNGGVVNPQPTNPPPPPRGAASVRTYTVAEGDTLTSIAAAFGVNTGQLLAANNEKFKHPSQFTAGSEINIPAADYSPPSVLWQVQPGEYLNQIIRDLQANDTNPDKIAAANPCGPGVGVCSPDYQLFPYDVLTIPFH